MVDPPPLIRPAHGAIRAGFRYDRTTPFAVGQRRGLTLSVRPGSALVAPCRGRVTFAGRMPRGRAISLRCDGWAVTVLGVAATVAADRGIDAGRAIGRATGTTVGLSVRRAADRWGYVDPQPSIVTPRNGTPLGPAPRSRPPRAVPVVRPGPAPRSVSPVTVSDRSSSRVPWLGAVGLILAALALPALRRRGPSNGRLGRPGTTAGADRAPRLWTDARPAVPSIGNGLLRHDTDLLRQRRATPRARVLDDRR